MNQSELKKFAQNTRRKLMRQIESRLDYVFNHDDPYLRTHSREKKKIESLLQQKGKEQLLEETAYIVPSPNLMPPPPSINGQTLLDMS